MTFFFLLMLVLFTFTHFQREASDLLSLLPALYERRPSDCSINRPINKDGSVCGQSESNLSSNFFCCFFFRNAQLHRFKDSHAFSACRLILLRLIHNPAYSDMAYMSFNVGWLKCCFTSTETLGLLGTGAQDGHLHFHTAPQLSAIFNVRTCSLCTSIHTGDCGL